MIYCLCLVLEGVIGVIMGMGTVPGLHRIDNTPSWMELALLSKASPLLCNDGSSPISYSWELDRRILQNHLLPTDVMTCARAADRP